MGRGPAQVGATAAIALGFTKPFFAARTTIEAACPPPKITNSLSSLTPTMLFTNNNHETNIYSRKYPNRRQSMDKHKTHFASAIHRRRHDRCKYSIR
jgi:hypothetical protein